MPVLSRPLHAGRRGGPGSGGPLAGAAFPRPLAAGAVHGQVPGPFRARPRGLAQPRPVPGPLRTPARPARPSEPFLVPKLRNRFADFPYLHCSTARGCSPWRPAADMGTARHENHTASPGFSRAGGGAPDTARAAVLYGSCDPISGRTDSRVSAPYKEKRTLPGAPASVSWCVCVAALGPEGPVSVSGSGNINPVPFRQPAAIVTHSLAIQAAKFRNGVPLCLRAD